LRKSAKDLSENAAHKIKVSGKSARDAARFQTFRAGGFKIRGR
jgi:hypothetical protein